MIDSRDRKIHSDRNKYCLGTDANKQTHNNSVFCSVFLDTTLFDGGFLEILAQHHSALCMA